MTRKRIREQIFKLLFRVEFHSDEELAVQEMMFFSEEGSPEGEDAEYISHKYENILAKLPEIDAAINEKSEGWITSRMSKVDLTIIRLAVYEILFDEAVPTSVAINEAVELAKKFGQDSSGGFVNGVLAKFA